MEFDIKTLLEKAKELQGKMEDVRQRMNKITAKGTAGAGMVEVQVNGNHSVIGVTIAEELIKQGDKKMIEDLVAAAVNNAINNVTAQNESEFGKLLPDMPSFV